MASVTLDVLAKKSPTNRASGHLAVVAVIPGPFSKVVGKIKGRRRRVGVFVVDEMDVLDVCRPRVSRFRREDDHIGTQQVAVGKDQLVKS